MFGKEKAIEKEKIINVPNYRLAFSYIDKGIPLYYFSLYQPHKLTTKAQVIDALSRGVILYTGVREEDYEEK